MDELLLPDIHRHVRDTAAGARGKEQDVPRPQRLYDRRDPMVEALAVEYRKILKPIP